MIGSDLKIIFNGYRYILYRILLVFGGNLKTCVPVLKLLITDRILKGKIRNLRSGSWIRILMYEMVKNCQFWLI